MRDMKVWKFLSDELKKNKNAMLVSVVDSKGSSPGKAGFKMAVSKTGDFVGTIGGGEMELQIVKESVKMLKQKTTTNVLETLYHGSVKGKKQSGLICAGSQTIFSYVVTKNDTQLLKAILKTYKTQQTGILTINSSGISFEDNIRLTEGPQFSYQNQTSWSYKENLGVREIIYIIGGGHVGLALSRQMEMLDFHIVVFDDRGLVPTIKDNIYANEIIITDYSKIGGFIREDDESYVAVVTSSYLTDKKALKQVINKKVKYIGVMGSKVKIKRIFDELRTEKIKLNKNQEIYAPIGLDIESENVSEIAISIAAQIIKVKNQKQ